MNLHFIVPGFSKCGTTSLCALLNQHPAIFIPEEKEPLFFIHEDHLDKLGWYEGLFAAAPTGARCGEGSTFYSSVTHERGSRDRILRFNPDIKLIFIARDPIARMESSFREFHHSGPHFGIDAPFALEDAIDALPAILTDACFWSRLSTYREKVRDENILLLFLEDLNANPAAVLERCFRFLGVDPRFRSADSQLRLNDGETKLYDSKLARRLRTSNLLRAPIARIPLQVQNDVGQRLGLRKPFGRSIEWSDVAKQKAVVALRDEVSSLLAYAGKPADFWPRFAAWAREFSAG
jgi:hypothetical protein